MYYVNHLIITNGFYGLTQADAQRAIEILNQQTKKQTFMKLPLKHSSIAMAICASLYALSVLIWQIPAVKGWIIWQTNIGYLPHVAVLTGMIFFGKGLYHNKEQIPRLPKPLHLQIIGIVITTLCAVVYNCFFDGYILIGGVPFFYWGNPWIHVAVIIWVAAWLLQFACAKSENTYANQALGISGIIVAIAAAILLILMISSYIRVLLVGQVFGFRTTTWVNWLKPLTLIAMGGILLLENHVIHKVKNECKEVQSYSKVNQVIAKVSAISLLFITILGVLSALCNWFENSYWGNCYLATAIGLIHLLWISSVMVMLLEKQLPKWHRILNILAPLVINGVIVLMLFLEAYIPKEVIYHLPTTFTEDIPIILVILSLVFVVVVWLINTFVVLKNHHINKNIV